MRSYIALLLFGLGLLPARAEPLPEVLQGRIAHLVHQDGTVRLRAVRDRYESLRQDLSARRRVWKRAGLTKEAIARIEARYGVPSALPAAEWEGDSLVWHASGTTLSLGPDEIWSHTLLVNGQPFAWQADRSIAENLNRYDALFSVHHTRSLWISEAWAGVDDAISLKAAGLQIYFIVKTAGESREQLSRLNEQVLNMVALCQAPENGRDDPFTTAVLQSTAQAQKVASRLSFKSCGDITLYAAKSAGRVIPKDLCLNLDRLALCMRQTMDPSAVTSSGQKKPRDASEWHEPTQPASRPASTPAK